MVSSSGLLIRLLSQFYADLHEDLAEFVLALAVSAVAPVGIVGECSIKVASTVSSKSLRSCSRCVNLARMAWYMISTLTCSKSYRTR